MTIPKGAYVVKLLDALGKEVYYRLTSSFRAGETIVKGRVTSGKGEVALEVKPQVEKTHWTFKGKTVESDNGLTPEAEAAAKVAKICQANQHDPLCDACCMTKDLIINRISDPTIQFTIDDNSLSFNHNILVNLGAGDFKFFIEYDPTFGLGAAVLIWDDSSRTTLLGRSATTFTTGVTEIIVGSITGTVILNSLTPATTLQTYQFTQESGTDFGNIQLKYFVTFSGFPNICGYENINGTREIDYTTSANGSVGTPGCQWEDHYSYPGDPTIETTQVDFFMKANGSITNYNWDILVRVSGAGGGPGNVQPDRTDRGVPQFTLNTANVNTEITNILRVCDPLGFAHMNNTTIDSSFQNWFQINCGSITGDNVTPAQCLQDAGYTGTGPSDPGDNFSGSGISDFCLDLGGLFNVKMTISKASP